MKVWRVAYRTFLLVVLGGVALQAASVSYSQIVAAGVPTPFGWQDEGYALGPTMAVYEGGWKEFRCRGEQVICYGAVQTFLDVLLLRALPDGWLHKDAVRDPRDHSPNLRSYVPYDGEFSDCLVARWNRIRSTWPRGKIRIPFAAGDFFRSLPSPSCSYEATRTESSSGVYCSGADRRWSIRRV